MTAIDHLEELRQRILVSLAAILVVTITAFFFSDNILHILLIPSGGLKLSALNLMDGLTIKIHISLYVGVAVAFPIWAFQLYSFFSPALLEHERRTILPALVFSSLLFVLGVSFGYYFLHEIIKVFMGFYSSEITYLASAQDYISFVLFFLLICGLTFQLPILLTILIQLRVLSVELLQKQRRIAYFILFVIAELVTPVADPFLAPMIVLIPLIVLYEISILAGRNIERQRHKAEMALMQKPMPEMEPAEEIPMSSDEAASSFTPGRYCTQCGTAARTLDARFCEQCGNQLGEAGMIA
jgi:sec-independent protein translocase protein TatC